MYPPILRVHLKKKKKKKRSAKDLIADFCCNFDFYFDMHQIFYTRTKFRGFAT